MSDKDVTDKLYFSFKNVKDKNPELEKYRNELIEQYLELAIEVIKYYKLRGKDLDDLLVLAEKSLKLIKSQRKDDKNN